MKIVDFGLAKLNAEARRAAWSRDHDAITGTAAGTVLGTVGYMSPEQASRRPADFRSDQPPGTADLRALTRISFSPTTQRPRYTPPSSRHSPHSPPRLSPPQAEVTYSPPESRSPPSPPLSLLFFLGRWRSRPAADVAERERPLIAVRPFTSSLDGPAQGYFAAGITERSEGATLQVAPLGS